MNKITLALQSRTFWTIALIVVGNAFNIKYHFVSANISNYVTTVLGILAAYFHVNPSQDYVGTITNTPPTPTPSSTGTPVV